MDAKLFIWTPKNEVVLKKNGIGYVKMNGVHGNPKRIKEWGMPTKVLISQLLLFLDY